MNTITHRTESARPEQPQYALRREAGGWQLTFEGRPAGFPHELGALYAACLLLRRPPEPLHAVALALLAREQSGPAAGPEEALAERSLRLEDAARVRAWWRRQRELERVLADRLEIEPVKAEALRELEALTEALRTSPWLSRHRAERCVRAVAAALKRFQAHLAGALDARDQPEPVLRAFARHLHEYLLIPSGRGGRRAAASVAAGCFTYQPSAGMAWTGSLRDEDRARL